MLTRPVFLYVLVLLITYFSWISFGLDVVGPDRLDLGGNTSATNTSLSKPSSFADIIDKALEKEFTENDQNEGPRISCARAGRAIRFCWLIAVMSLFGFDFCI
uniref:K+ efflux antiporter family protein n=1 Tax=Rhizophora mucronata TaxID=61149 RepID=A0A2P2M705_RHIMU